MTTPYAWAIDACSRMWRGEFAEMDAKAEAARCGGTCTAFPLYTLEHVQNYGQACFEEGRNSNPPPEPMQRVDEPVCNPHPDAPHGFNRNASHDAHRYVCDCERWTNEPVLG